MKKTELPFVVFEATSRCNLNCRYCYNIWKIPGRKADDLYSYKYAKKTLKKLFSIADIWNVSMSGGEPFLSERFPELVLFTKMNNKNVTVITNGNAADEEDYKEMIDLGVNLFELPLHSSDHTTHDCITRVRGSWERSRDSISALLSLGGNVVAVIVLTRLNFRHIESTLSYLWSLGIRRIMLNRFNIGGEGIRERKNILLSHDELRETFTKADQFAKDNNLSLSSNVCTPVCVLDPKDYTSISFGHCAFDPKKMPITVDLHGNMRLCNHSPMILGNIFKQRIDDMLNSGYVKKWSKDIPQYCSGCREYGRCKGGCRAASEQMGNSILEPDPILMEV